jgi:hypothetical protein
VHYPWHPNHTDQEHTMSTATYTAAAAAHVRALRRAHLGVSARQAAFEARRAIGAAALLGCVA